MKGYTRRKQPSLMQTDYIPKMLQEPFFKISLQMMVMRRSRAQVFTTNCAVLYCRLFGKGAVSG